MNLRKYRKNTMDFGGAAVLGSGFGAALAGVGGPVSEYGQQGLQNMASFMPATGSMLGASMMMDAVPKLSKKKRRR